MEKPRLILLGVLATLSFFSCGADDSHQHNFQWDYTNTATTNKRVMKCVSCGLESGETEVMTVVATKELLTETLTATTTQANPLFIADDITIEKLTTGDNNFHVTQNIEVYLNGKTLTLHDPIEVSSSDENNPASLTFENGTVKFATSLGKNAASIGAYANSTITLDHATLETDTSGIQAKGKNVIINVRNHSTIKPSGNYAVYASHETATDAPENVTFLLKDCAITMQETTTETEGCAVLFTGKGWMDIEDSTISGARQGIVIRGGGSEKKPHSIEDTKITITGNNDTTDGLYYNTTWGTNSKVPMAAIVIGNREDMSSSLIYPHATYVELDDVITVKGDSCSGKKVSDYYIYQQSSEYPVHVTFDDIGTTKITVNDTTFASAQGTVTNNATMTVE